ncbi:MAG TPA: GrpB family protein [Opitutaceae bacterium]|nr:GrpB family protein [Opitutaceae bacterium]
MIVIAPYDPAWPAEFSAEAVRIHDALGHLALRIEHVGSTSVPGLAAKPVIDIQISVASLEPRDLYCTRLAELGYTHFPLGEFDRVYPFFKRPAGWPGTHHVHLCVRGSEQERAHLAFRDYLRRNPAVAAEYAALKRTLAAGHDGLTLESQERYSLAKMEFVRSVLSRALPQAQSTPPRHGA